MSNIVVVSQASAFPTAGWNALQADESRANHILPILLSCRKREQSGMPTKNHTWAVVFSKNDPNSVLFVLSITDSILSTYPVFLYTTIPYKELSHERLAKPMLELVNALQARGVSRRRVYSAFGPRPLAKAFGVCWSQLTGVPVVDKEYYDSWLSTITPDTFRRGSADSDDTETLTFRMATEEDVIGVATLCYEFAATSPPFQISEQQAYKEAGYLVNNRLVWVCKAWRKGSWEVVSLVAYTRNTKKTAAITKVFTLPDARGQSIARKLTGTVCRHLFNTDIAEISLFVGIDNMAGVVYSRLGFRLPPVLKSGQEVPADFEANGVERWTEIGFERSQVNLGIW